MKAATVILSIGILFAVTFISCQPEEQAGTNNDQLEGIDIDTLAHIMLLEDRRNADMEVFGALLEVEDPAIRAKACIALGRIGSAEVGLTFLDNLGKVLSEDKDGSVRAAAAFALGKTGSADAKEALQAAMKDEDPQVRLRAVDAFTVVGESSDAERIIEVFDAEEDTGVKERILLSSWRLSSPLTAQKAQAILMSEADELHWSAAYHLTRNQATRQVEIQVEAIAALAESDDVELRKCAARLLPHLRDNTVVADILENNLLKDPDDGVRINALRTASTMAYPGLPPILDSMLESENPQLRLEAVTAACRMAQIYQRAELGDSEEIKVVQAIALEALDDEEEAVAAAAVRGLAPFGAGTEMGSKVDELLNDKRNLVRAAAANLALVVGGEEAFDRLVKGIVDAESNSVVMSSLQAFSKLQNEEVPVKLTQLLNVDDQVLVSFAASFFQEVPFADALEHLVKAFDKFENEKDTEALRGIIAALGSYQGSDEAAGILRRALKNDKRDIRLAAARILQHIDGEDVLKEVGNVDTGKDITHYKSVIAALREYSKVKIKTTKGDIVFELKTDEAPLTCANIISLAQKDFFDGTIIHRVVPDFVAQMGDPRGDGWGGPGYSIRCEVSTLPYSRGAVGMARSGVDTGSSQFFFTISPQPHLEGGYTIFGETVSGIEVTEKLVPGDKILDVEVLK